MRSKTKQQINNPELEQIKVELGMIYTHYEKIVAKLKEELKPSTSNYQVYEMIKNRMDYLITKGPYNSPEKKIRLNEIELVYNYLEKNSELKGREAIVNLISILDKRKDDLHTSDLNPSEKFHRFIAADLMQSYFIYLQGKAPNPCEHSNRSEEPKKYQTIGELNNMAKRSSRMELWE